MNGWMDGKRDRSWSTISCVKMIEENSCNDSRETIDNRAVKPFPWLKEHFILEQNFYEYFEIIR